MTRRSRSVLNIGRWRIAFLYGHGPYGWGFHVKTLMGKRIGFDAGMRVVVLSVLRRSR